LGRVKIVMYVVVSEQLRNLRSLQYRRHKRAPSMNH
jgi:hypothetical protein